MSDPAAGETGEAVRRAARAGYGGLTVGRAPGYMQANLVLLPAEDAGEFVAYCRANPAACPILGVGQPGATAIDGLGSDLDLRHDLPAYLVHAAGTVRRVRDLGRDWRPDLVGVAIGCWFGAEAALARAGIRLRHVELGIQGPLFRTNIATAPVGRFGGPLVVSMRPFATPDVARVRAVTAELPLCHGAPLGEGDPARLGIVDPDQPDWGEKLEPEAGETALFWPCGLTALAALEGAGLPFFVTHAPGAMLLTDLREPVS